jgi:hypothetical protein
MDVGLILSNIGISICFILGLVAIIKPEYTKQFVGIYASSKEGESEIKATYGDFFVGISVYAFVTQSSDVFTVIAIGWLTAALIRLSTFFKGSYSHKNFGGVIFETVVGMLCLSKLIS